MKNELNFIEIINRAKKALKINDDKQLAQRLGLNGSSFHGRKKAKSVPFNALFSLCNSEKIDFNWVLTGEGNMRNDEISEPLSEYQVSIKETSELLGELSPKQVNKFKFEIEEEIEFNEMKKALLKKA